MKERTGELTFKGNPMTLLGDKVTVGQKAPDFTLITNKLGRASLADSAGKVRLISVVPSLDTGICDQQTRKFNEAASSLGEGVAILTVSADLPFAQGRWCGAAGVDRVETLSDHFDMNFGNAYGTHVKELRLDSRAVFVVDASGTVTYAQYCGEIAEHPDYDSALAAVKSALG
ncbi:MAG: thiol peroxidase [Candidatus Hydrogenedentes bacterium]|nr:thiol peroxidase [Candidatus Hydrogenedentota bacterium]